MHQPKALRVCAIILAIICLSVAWPVSKTLGAAPNTYPSIDTIKNSAESDEIDTISTAGGEQITIEGTGFAADAKVYFVPVLKRYSSSSSSSSTTASIIYTSGSGNSAREWTITSGALGTSVTVADSNTIEVTTPAGSLFTWGVMVVNADGGASEIYDDLTYDFPQPEAPWDVAVKMIHDSSGDRDLGIRISWDSVADATGYEIYRVEDGNYYYLASTNLTSYMYTDVQEDTDYRFAVKAINNCGLSEASDVSSTITTDEVGSLENLLLPDNEPAAVRSGDRAFLNLNDLTFYPRNIHMDLTKGNLKGCHEVVVDIPVELIVNTRQHQIEIDGRGYNLKFSPAVFATDQVREYRKYKAGVRLRFSEVHSTNSKLYAGRALSPIYQLDAQLMYGTTTIPLAKFDGFVDLNVIYNGTQVGWSSTDTGLYYYDGFDETWVKANNYGANLGGLCSGLLDRTGYYKVISQ